MLKPVNMVMYISCIPAIVRDMVNIRDPEENSGKNWVIGNCLQYGYYRVNYDDRNWNALMGQLEEDHTVIVFKSLH